MTNMRGDWVKVGLFLAFAGLCLVGTVPGFSEEQKCPVANPETPPRQMQP